MPAHIAVHAELLMGTFQEIRGIVPRLFYPTWKAPDVENKQMPFEPPETM